MYIWMSHLYTYGYAYMCMIYLYIDLYLLRFTHPYIYELVDRKILIPPDRYEYERIKGTIGRGSPELVAPMRALL